MATSATTPTASADATLPPLITRGLTRSFGEMEALPPLDLRLERGERLALRGPNGSGKTTLLRCLAGTLIPSGGEAFIGPHPAGSLEARELLGASLAVERSFYLRLTGRANLLLFARLRHTAARRARQQVDALIEELELEEIAARRLDACSTGMLQQVAFARALLGRPQLLLLDEPTRSLDRDAIDRVWGALERRPELAAIVASHRPDDAANCGRSLDLSR